MNASAFTSSSLPTSIPFCTDVEHTGNSGRQAAGLAPLPQLHFEGFEPSPYHPDDIRAEVDDITVRYQAYIYEYYPSTAQETVEHVSDAPVFDLGRVQYAFPAPLISFVVSSDMLAMGFVSNSIVLIELSHADQVIKVQIPRKPTEMTIHKLFMDPSGRHIIITSQQGENWYLFRTWKKPRQLKGFKMVIESVAWNKSALLSSSPSTSTKEILIGARNGVVYEAVLDAKEDFLKSQERYLQSVFSLPERHPITGIKFDYSPPSDPKHALVLVTTPTRIYQFFGVVDRKSEEGGRVFSTLFAQYRETVPSKYIIIICYTFPF
jgi:hypothetical protein